MPPKIQRPSNPLSKKENLNPSIDRYNEATAEDFIEISKIINALIDAAEQPAPVVVEDNNPAETKKEIAKIDNNPVHETVTQFLAPKVKDNNQLEQTYIDENGTPITHSTDMNQLNFLGPDTIKTLIEGYFDFTKNYTGLKPKIGFKNADGSYYEDFTGQYGASGTGGTYRFGLLTYFYAKFDKVTTGSAPDPKASLVIYDLHHKALPAAGLPGMAVSRLIHDDAAGDNPSWTSENWQPYFKGASNVIYFQDQKLRRPVGGLPMNNATIQVVGFYLAD